MLSISNYVDIPGLLALFIYPAESRSTRRRPDSVCWYVSRQSAAETVSGWALSSTGAPYMSTQPPEIRTFGDRIVTGAE